MKQASKYGVYKAARGSEGSGNGKGAAKANKSNSGGSLGKMSSTNKARNKTLHYGSKTNY